MHRAVLDDPNYPGEERPLAYDRTQATFYPPPPNSNALNVLAGVCIPARVIGSAEPSPRIVFAAC